MIPDIKYKLGQEVWYNDIPKAKTMNVVALKILCTYNGYSADEWGQTTRGNGGYPFRVLYSDEVNPKEDQWTSQELLFATKEELLKSL